MSLAAASRHIKVLEQAEIWLQVVSDDVPAGAKHLAAENIARRDEIEPSPDGFNGFWISSPASISHLVCTPSA